MTKKQRILLVTLLIAAIGAASLLPRPDPEPTYQGKPLSYWLERCQLGSTDDARAQGTEAMRQIGTNAIPKLLRMFNARDSKFKLLLIQLTPKQHLIHLYWKMASLQHCGAQFGFASLGPAGQSAVPELLKTYLERRPGPCNTPWDIAFIFGFMGPAASNAVPQLVQATTDTNFAICWSAVAALGQIHARPDLAVPALIKSLSDPIENVRMAAAGSLADFGSDAKSAIPELVKALTDPSFRVKNAAAIALKKIDPTAATQAGVK